MNANLKKWLAGLEAAVVTGGANTIGLVVANSAFDLFKDTASLWKAIGTATLISAAAYLKSSPLPFYTFEGGSEPTPVEAAKSAVADAVAKVSVIFLALGIAFGIGACAHTSTKVVSAGGTAATAPALSAADQAAVIANKIKPFLRPSAAAAGIGAELSASTADEKVKVANYLYATAVGVRSLAGTTPPSVTEFQTVISTFSPNSTDNIQQWTDLLTSLTSLYASVLPSIPPDATAILQALEQIALGLEDAAKPYVAPTPAPVAPAPAVEPAKTSAIQWDLFMRLLYRPKNMDLDRWLAGEEIWT